MHETSRQHIVRIAAMATILAGWALVAGMLPARGSTPLVLGDLPADSRLSVLTYNVEGLPWPARFGRGASLDAIGERLRAMRTAGHQPHIVVLQEAFSDDARRIGTTAGYRYIAEGPTTALRGAEAITADERAFEASASLRDGERAGKLVGSGLRILSDYPIAEVRRLAFPAYACAGYDCMANKGAVMAMIRVPGLPQPVAVVDTHLNSKAASGASRQRALYAFQRQVDALSNFLKDNYTPGSPLIVAGDFNVGKNEKRIDYLQKASLGWWNGVGAPGQADALRACAADACARAMSDDARRSLKQRKDFQIVGDGHGLTLAAQHVATPFGRDADGSMLSDHVGYTVYYQWTPRSGGVSRS